MYNPNPTRRRRNAAFDPALDEIVIRQIPVNASLPPPADSLSSTKFVTSFLLISMAIVAAIALIVTAPMGVTIPLGVVFFAYLLGTSVLYAGERLRQRRRGGRGNGPSGVGRLRRHEPHAANRISSGVGALAVFSIGLLGAAFVVPEQLGAALAALGLAGLFVLRVFAMSPGSALRARSSGRPVPGSDKRIA